MTRATHDRHAGATRPAAVDAMLDDPATRGRVADLLLDAEPALGGAGLAEYRAQRALMEGNPQEAAEWLARSVSPRASYLRTIHAALRH